jgi:hypothetical protein
VSNYTQFQLTFPLNRSFGRWYGGQNDYSLAACKLFCINRHMTTSVAPGTHRCSCYREICLTACVIHSFSEKGRHCDIVTMSGLPFSLRYRLRTKVALTYILFSPICSLLRPQNFRLAGFTWNCRTVRAYFNGVKMQINK